ncbi:MAG: hypothetical protein ACKJR1_07650 [Limisphaerales bacterium]
MKPYTLVLAWAVASLMLLGGCSKTTDTEAKDTEEVTDELDGAGEEHSNLPALSKTGPITRQADGLWHETKGGNIFSGAVVHEQDSIRWEEKYEKGVRVFVRAWDEDGIPVALHSWNADGSPAD